MSDEKDKVKIEIEETLDDLASTSIALLGCSNAPRTSITGFTCLSGIPNDDNYKENKKPENYNKDVILPDDFEKLPPALRMAYLSVQKYQ